MNLQTAFSRCRPFPPEPPPPRGCLWHLRGAAVRTQRLFQRLCPTAAAAAAYGVPVLLPSLDVRVKVLAAVDTHLRVGSPSRVRLCQLANLALPAPRAERDLGIVHGRDGPWSPITAVDLRGIQLRMRSSRFLRLRLRLTPTALVLALLALLALTLLLLLSLLITLLQLTARIQLPLLLHLLQTACLHLVRLCGSRTSPCGGQRGGLGGQRGGGAKSVPDANTTTPTASIVSFARAP